MSKLLRANFARLTKDRLILCCLLITLLAAVIYAAGSKLEAQRLAEIGEYGHDCFDLYYFNMLPVLPIVSAVTVSMFLGKEYSFKTIRNKLVSGQTRSGIYAANLITNITVSAEVTAAYFIRGLAGIITMPNIKTSTGLVLTYVALTFLLMSAYAAVYTFIGMLISSRSNSVVLTIIISLVLIVTGAVLYNKLCEPETVSGIIITAEGMEMGDPQPNPSYIGGNLREVISAAINILPSGEAILIANLEADKPLFYTVSSLCIIFIFTLSGMAVFRRKDLK